jgi:hypothetical protein
MTDDAAYAAALREIDQIRARLRRVTEAAGMIEAPRTYTSAELSDRDFFKRNEQDILAAAREPGTPRILEAEPIERPAPVYPPTDIPRLTQVGPGMYVSEPLPPKKKER